MINKIKLRNLDPEVLAQLGGGSGGGGFYNDEELRNRIQNLEDTTISEAEAMNRFVVKNDGTVDSVDEKIDLAKNEISSKYDEKIANLELDVVKKQPNSISEEYLTDSLRDKINENGNIDTELLRKEFASITSVADLRDRATNHENEIEGIKRSLHNDYIQKTDRIKTSNLSDELRNRIENTRAKNIPISLGDLDENLRMRINGDNMPGYGNEFNREENEKFQNLVQKFSGKKSGEIFYAIHNDELGTDDIGARYLYSDKIVVIAKSSLLQEVETWASVYNKNYIVDIQENAIYLYKTENSSWERQAETAFSFMAGQMASEFGTGDIYFGTSTENCKKIMSNTDTRKIECGTVDIAENESPLRTGDIYIVYEG